MCIFVAYLFFCIELVIDTGCSIYRVGQKSCTYLTQHIFGTVLDKMMRFLLLCSDMTWEYKFGCHF